ncbi:MAG: hypothetical protein WC362_01070 [Methanoregula sp.]
MINIKLLPIISVFILALVLSGAGCLGTGIPAINKTDPPAVVVDYQRSGGSDGVHDRLVIFDNGEAVVSGRSASTVMTLNATDIALISALFNQSQFWQLQTNYSAPHSSADLMTYTISYHGKTVTAAETAMPPSLKTVVGELDRILQRVSPQKSVYPTLGITR